MPTISIANQKGGVSKTTTTQALATLLNKRNKKALCIDLDPQANLSFAMGAKLEDTKTVYDMLKGKTTAMDVIQNTKSGDVLPSNILLSVADMEFTAQGREYLLKEAINDLIRQYEYILIDCPPALSILTINAFTASDFVIIPSLADVFSLQGMAQLHDTISGVKKYSNPHLSVAGILLTRFNERLNLSGHMQGTLNEVSRNMDTVLFKTYIRNSVALQESQFQQEDIFNYDMKSKAMADYAQFLDELEVLTNG